MPKPRNKHSIKTLIVSLIVITICTSIYFFIESKFDEIIFIFSIIIGLILIRNSFQEDRQVKTIYLLVDKLKEINERLLELDNLKTEFVSLASHQLRSPLAKIQGYSSMILEEEYGKFPEYLKEPLQRIFLSSQNLGSLLNDFLDVAQIEKGEAVYNLNPISIVEVLNKVEENFKDVFDNTGILFKTTYDKSSDLKILGDFKKVVSAISKILDNAIRYTPQGQIIISLAEKNNDLIITIKDTGVGIEQSEIEELFKKFKRGKNSYNVSVSGSGLGLYVAREIVESQEGRIWLKSEGEGRGTTAFIAFPLLRN
ncbi:MAG: HAMP domain-containing histidine kinase [Candidatus Pacebacteria bacterium]|nr:HAMP domain-containing histidine kinase [Candidatus Paceibacterota bacterium]